MAITFAGLATAKPKKETKEKPHLPDPTGELLPLVGQAIENKKNVEAFDAALTSAKAKLTAAAFAHACVQYHGRDSKIEDTFQIGTASGKALISLKNSYKLTAENVDEVRAILGDHASDFIRESFHIAIDSDAMPRMVQQAFVDGLVQLARDMDSMIGTEENGPTFQSITVQPVLAIDKSFHEKRYSLLSPEENARLQTVMPCQMAVKLDY